MKFIASIVQDTQPGILGDWMGEMQVFDAIQKDRDWVNCNVPLRFYGCAATQHWIGAAHLLPITARTLCTRGRVPAQRSRKLAGTLVKWQREQLNETESLVAPL